MKRIEKKTRMAVTYSFPVVGERCECILVEPVPFSRKINLVKCETAPVIEILDMHNNIYALKTDDGLYIVQVVDQ